MNARIDFDAVLRLLPDLREIHPLQDAMLRAATPNPDDTWSTTGELATVGRRWIDAEALPSLARRAAERESERVTKLYGVVVGAIDAAARGNVPGSVSHLLDAAALEEAAGRAREAAAFSGAAAKRARHHGLAEQAGLALRRQARAERALGDLGTALARYLDALETARAVEDHAGLAEAAIGAGNVVEQQGRWSEAEHWYREALTALEQVPDHTPAHWHARLTMHIVLRSRGHLSQSLPWLEQAETLARTLDDPDRHPFLENARGQLWMAEGDPERAEACFLAALQGARTPRAAATIRLNLAESLLARGRTLDAAEEARDAEREALAGPADKLPEVYRMLGRVAAASGNTDAFVLFERALDLAGDVPSLLLERAQTLQAYGDAEGMLGRADTAADLWRAARDAYAELAVPGFRRTWADCFDAPIPSLDSKDSPS